MGCELCVKLFHFCCWISKGHPYSYPPPSPPGEAPYACLLIPLVGEGSVVGTPNFFTTPLVFASKDLLSKKPGKSVAA